MAEWRGRPLISYALRALRDAGIEPRIVTPDPARLEHLGMNFVTDETPGKGPLEGVRVALVAADTPWSVILTADMPEVAPLIRVLLRTLPETDPEVSDLVCFRDAENRLQPFPGLYHRSLLSRWQILGRESMYRLLETAAVTSLPIETTPDLSGEKDLFRNINEPRDLTP